MNNLSFQNTNSQLVAIPVLGVAGTGNQQGRIQFPNLPYLDGTFCRSLEVYTVNDMATGPDGTAVIASATLKKAFLTLYIKDNAVGAGNGRGGEWIQQLPLSSLHCLSNGTDPFEQEKYIMAGQIISWDKCYITLSTPIGNTTNQVFLLNVGFDFNPEYKGN